MIQFENVLNKYLLHKKCPHGVKKWCGKIIGVSEVENPPQFTFTFTYYSFSCYSAFKNGMLSAIVYCLLLTL